MRLSTGIPGAWKTDFKEPPSSGDGAVNVIDGSGSRGRHPVKGNNNGKASNKGEAASKDEATQTQEEESNGI